MVMIRLIVVFCCLFTSVAIAGDEGCGSIGLRNAYRAMDMQGVKACFVYTKAEVQIEEQLSRDPDGISFYSITPSESPKLVFDFPYAGTEGKISDAFVLPVSGVSEKMLFVLHRMETPRAWDAVSDIYDVSVVRLGKDSWFLDKNYTRFFDLGGDLVDEQGRLTYTYPYKDRSSIEGAVRSPLFYALVEGKEIMGTILEKAVLFDGGSEPLQQSSTEIFLNDGERVLVKDSTAGWCKVFYQVKAKTDVKWVQCKSIGFSAD
jgi:hypothetical protein